METFEDFFYGNNPDGLVPLNIPASEFFFYKYSCSVSAGDIVRLSPDYHCAAGAQYIGHRERGTSFIILPGDIAAPDVVWMKVLHAPTENYTVGQFHSVPDDENFFAHFEKAESNFFKIDFEFTTQERFTKAHLAYEEIQRCKETDDWQQTEEDWRQFFDERSMSHFWKPSAKERSNWEARWFSTPVEERFTDPSLRTPWDFMSMIEAFRDADFVLMPFVQTGPNSGALTINPLAHPFGAIGSLQVFLEAFELKIVGHPELS